MASIMAEMVWSALVQEAVSRGISFVLGKREEKASQGYLMERLEMVVSRLEFALERAKEFPIRHISLLDRRKMIKRAYVEAMELLDKHKQQQGLAPGLELQVAQAQGVKRKRSFFWAKDMPIIPSATVSTDDVRRFELYADFADKFVREVESGCSLHHYTFSNRITRHLYEGKTLRYYLVEQGNLIREFYIWPMYCDDRGLEAVLEYCYHNSTVAQKCFTLVLFLRLSESTDIVGVSIKCLQLLTSEFKLAAEFAMGELTILSNLQDITHSYGPPWVGIQERYMNDTQVLRTDPTCCKRNRHGLCANNVLSELSDMSFPEKVIFFGFWCYYIPALETRSSCSSFDVVGRNRSRGGGNKHLLLTAAFGPHHVTETHDGYALKSIGDVQEYSDASIQQVVAEALTSDAINCFIRKPEQTEYRTFWRSKHGGAWFWVKKESMEVARKAWKSQEKPKTSRRYNTRGSTRRSRRREA